MTETVVSDASPAVARVEKPFVGLTYYREEDAAIFFGRDEEAELIAANLMASRLTLLYAESGVGKSSVLRAGVAHHLNELARRNIEERGEPEFCAVVFNAWQDEDAIASLSGAVEDAVRKLQLPDREIEPAPRSRSLVELLRFWSGIVGGDLLIVLDQFEEYFLYHPDEQDEGTFAVEFAQAVATRDLRANFIISIREDALGKLDRFKVTIPTLFKRYLRIDHLERDQARKAIEEPVHAFNRQAGNGEVTVEPALVEAVLTEVSGRAGWDEGGRGNAEEGEPSADRTRVHAPLLQLVMSRIWEKDAGSGALRKKTLDDLGGAKEIAQAHLEDAMTALSDLQQELIADAFDHLVTPSGTKIAQTRTDLEKYVADDLDRPTGPELPDALELLVSRRILRKLPPPPDQLEVDDRYEIAHDVLGSGISAWRNQYVEGRRRQRAERRAEQARRRVRMLGIAAIAFLLLAGVAAFKWREAEEQRKTARSGELASKAVAQLPFDPELSALLSLEALDQQETRQAEEALRRSVSEIYSTAELRGHDDVVEGGDFSPNGRLAVTVSDDGTARTWNMPAGTLASTFERPSFVPASAAFAPRGSRVVAAGKGGAWVWDGKTGESAHRLKTAASVVYAPTFSSDGTRVVGVGADGAAYVWRASDGEQIARLGEMDFVISAAFAANARRVVTAAVDLGSYEARVHVWDVASRRRVLNLLSDADLVQSARYSPDGKRIVTAGADGTARVFDARSGRHVTEMRWAGTALEDAVFSGDGTLVVTYAVDSARVFNASTGDIVAELRGHTSWIDSAVFSRDGNLVATSSQDNTARVWEVDTGETLAELRGHRGIVWSAVFDPTGRYVLTASEDATARLWDLATGRILRGHENDVAGASFSADGQRVVTWSYDRTGRVWDAETGELVRKLEGWHSRSVRSAAFSPDGQRVVTTGDDGVAFVWDVQGGAPTEIEPDGTPEVWDAAFSPDGATLVTVTADGKVLAWDAGTGKPKPDKPLYTNEGNVLVTSVDFQPDGSLIAIGTRDKNARVLDAKTGELEASLSGHTAVVFDVAFSPDGKLVTTASADGTARVWDWAAERRVAELRGHSRALTTAKFSRDGDWIITASSDGTVRVWDWRDGKTLAVIRKHADTVASAEFGPDGKQILSAGGRTAKIYACETCKPLKEVMRLARGKLKRKLTTEERETHLAAR